MSFYVIKSPSNVTLYSLFIDCVIKITAKEGNLFIPLVSYSSLQLLLLSFTPLLTCHFLVLYFTSLMDSSIVSLKLLLLMLISSTVHCFVHAISNSTINNQ